MGIAIFDQAQSISVNKNQVLTESGRSAWYNEDGKPVETFVLGIAGGSASGKTSVARQIINKLNVPWVVIVSQDNFYKSLSPEQSERAFKNQYDFDCPDAFEYDSMKECIADLKACKAVQIPKYSFSLHQRLKETQYLYGAAILIVEGIFVLQDPQIRKLLDLKIFVQCDPDIMLARRIRRDIVERGRDVTGILDQYLQFVKPSFDNFILATAKFADVIVPGADNAIAIDLIVTHIRKRLDELRQQKLRSLLGKTPSSVPPTPNKKTMPSTAPENVIVMPETTQLRVMHTILRDQSTSQPEFIFVAKRLASLLIEFALSHLEYTPRTIQTPTGVEYRGKKLDLDVICGLTILRSGACLEQGLRRVLSCALGSVLIQSDSTSGEPLLYHLSLPSCLKQSQKEASKMTVLVLDSQIGTGAAALMACRILLDHGVKEENIILVCYLVSSQGGVNALYRAFPKIRIMTSAVDPHLEVRYIPAGSTGGEESFSLVQRSVDDRKVWSIVPGLGSFG